MTLVIRLRGGRALTVDVGMSAVIIIGALEITLLPIRCHQQMASTAVSYSTRAWMVPLDIILGGKALVQVLPVDRDLPYAWQAKVEIISATNAGTVSAVLEKHT
jgi:hypothetical protein